jgi:hypothetical protein
MPTVLMDHTDPFLGLIYYKMYTKHRHELRHARKACKKERRGLLAGLLDASLNKREIEDDFGSYGAHSVPLLAGWLGVLTRWRGIFDKILYKLRLPKRAKQPFKICRF